MVRPVLCQSAWLKLAIMIYDCRHAIISLNGLDVTRMTVLGLAVEFFLYLAIRENRGFASLEPNDVKEVLINHCYLAGIYQRSPIRVKVLPEWSPVALLLAKRVTDHCHNAGIRIFDALRPHYRGHTKLGEHDLVGEYVGADRPGLISIEVKCQTVQKPANLPQYRKDLRKTQADENPMWLHCKTLKKPLWLERHVIMIDFASADSERYREIRCDALDKCGHWKDLYGWGGSAINVSSSGNANAQPPSRPASVAARPASGATINGEAIYQSASVRKASKRQLEYASVGDFLKEMHVQIKSESARKKRRHLEHWSQEWPKQFKWKGHDWDMFPEFRSSHGGGRTGFGATKKACMDIFRHCQ